MADLKEFFEAIVKYGVLPIFCVWVWQQDREIEEIKTKMYECFDDKEDILKNKISNDTNKKSYIMPYMVAVLPCKEHDKYEYSRKN
jgi:hypothetical protein